MIIPFSSSVIPFRSHGEAERLRSAAEVRQALGEVERRGAADEVAPQPRQLGLEDLERLSEGTRKERHQRFNTPAKARKMVG